MCTYGGTVSVCFCFSLWGICSVVDATIHSRASVALSVLTMLIELQTPIVIVCTISILVATFAFACRLWARILTKRKWQADDYLMLVAYV